MAVKIRLRRMGAKKAPFYRVVVADSRFPRDGRFIEEVGYYNPLTDPAEVKVDAEAVKKWIANGAQPTDTVKGLLKKAEAMKQYGEAAKVDMQMEALKLYFEQLPAIAKAVGEGYQGVDKIVMLGNDSGQLAGNMMANITQIVEGFKGSTGIDPTSVLSGMFGAKLVDKN